jgi:hypothetical protein
MAAWRATLSKVFLKGVARLIGQRQHQKSLGFALGHPQDLVLQIFRP